MRPRYFVRMRRWSAVLFVTLVTLVSGGACSSGGPTTTWSTSGAGSVAPADYAEVTPVVRMSPIPGATKLPATAVLAGPDFALHVAETATVDHLDAEWLRRARLA